MISKKLALAVLMSTALAGCALTSKGPTLATVNAVDIRAGYIDDKIKVLKAQNPQLQESQALRNSLLERAILRSVIIAEAHRLKLDQDPEFKNFLTQASEQSRRNGLDQRPTFRLEWADFEEESLVRAYMDHVLRMHPATDQEIKALYDKEVANLKGSYEVRLGEIVTRSEAEAKRAIAALTAGKRFADVAVQYSISPDVKKTGGLKENYLVLKDLQAVDATVYAAIKDLNKGRFTRTALKLGDDLYVVLYVHDRRPFVAPAMDKVRDALVQRINTMRLDAALGVLLKQAKIEIKSDSERAVER